MMGVMPEVSSKQAEQLRAWDQELALTGRVEIGYGARSVLWISVLVGIFVLMGLGLTLTGDATDRILGIGCMVMFGGAGALALVQNARPGPPLVVDGEGVHLQRPKKRDVPWEIVRNAYVLRSQQGPTVALVVLEPDGRTSSVELGRMIGKDRKTLAAWLATKARAPQP
jgi:hypothetical protein